MKHVRLDRRTLLRGIGSIAIGMPFLEEMMLTSALASTPSIGNEIPVRAFNVFFGLGIPAPLQVDGFDGVLEPLKPLADKLLIMRNIDQVRCDQTGLNSHFDGASGAFTAEPPAGEAKSGGPSIDQVIRQRHYAGGMPSGMVPTLCAGTFFRRSRLSRYVHSYNEDGTVAARMQERPRDVFDRVFGTIVFGGDADARKQRLRRSVLDSVVDQYKFYQGPQSPLGANSKSRIADHLDRIREFEQRAYELKARDPDEPELPPRSKLVHGGQADPGGEGLDMRLEELTNEWRLMADLYAMAIQLDRVRFGALTFLAAGERLRMTGDYFYEGRKIYSFNDAKQLNRSGSAGCSHEWWHRFKPPLKNTQLKAHVHMNMNEIAYFLKAIDNQNSLEANGKTILENSLLTIATESGDGRHSDSKRELSGVFHAISGANGRFKTGQTIDVGAEGMDVYNTMLDAMGCKARLGPTQRKGRSIDSIRI